MFIDAQLDLITAPAEPNVAAVINMALRWSANSSLTGAINIWPRRGQPNYYPSTQNIHRYPISEELLSEVDME